MKRFVGYGLSGLLAGMFFSGCKLLRPMPTPPPTPPPPLTALLNIHLPQQWYLIRGVVKYEGKQKLSSPFQLRMKPDSIIWLSITPALGIEALRLRIHQNDGDILNRIERRHYHFERDEIQPSLLPDSLLQLNELQRLLWGIAALRSLDDYQWETTDSAIIGTTVSDAYVDRLWIDPTTLRLKRRIYEETTTHRRILIEYADYQSLNDELIYPQKVIVSIFPMHEDKPSARSTLIFKKVMVSDHLEVPFSIPSSYESDP